MTTTGIIALTLVVIIVTAWLEWDVSSEAYAVRSRTLPEARMVAICAGAWVSFVVASV